MKILFLTHFGPQGVFSNAFHHLKLCICQMLPFLEISKFQVTILRLLDDQYINGLSAGSRKSLINIVKAHFNRPLWITQ
jgi:hypothetical protein